MQVAARLYATLFEVFFFPCQRWRIMLGIGISSPVKGLFWTESQEFLCRYEPVWSVNKDACVSPRS